MKKPIIILFILLIILATSIYLTADMEIIEAKVLYVYDVRNRDLLVQNSSHLFVAKVIEKNGYRYTKDDIPLTEYEVEVLECLKGDLNASSITIFKDAGKVKWKRQLIIPENDFFPEEGLTYIFIGNLSADDDFDIYSGLSI